MAIPYTIEAILDQLGRGMNGALIYVGASQIAAKDDEWEGVSGEHEHGSIRFQKGLLFSVNGKRGQSWKMVVALEPHDTYTVYLWRKAKPTEQREGKLGVVVSKVEDVYCDMLKDVVEQVYDDAIKGHCGGFIPL